MPRRRAPSGLMRNVAACGLFLLMFVQPAASGCRSKSPSTGLTPTPGLRDDAPTLRVDLIAHRTGLRWGRAVTAEEEDRHDPSYFVFFTNNDTDEDLPGWLRDFDDEAMKLPPSAETDDDIVRLTLLPVTACGSRVESGELSLSVSDPSAIRVFSSAGTVLKDWTVDLSRPTGELALLAKGPVDVWVEGLHKCRDLQIALSYEPDPRVAAGAGAADVICCRLVEWTFREPDGEELDRALVVDKDRLLDLARGVPDTTPLDPESLYKWRIDGMSSAELLELQVMSGAFDDDIAAVDIVDDGDAVESRRFFVTYLAPDGVPLTPDERLLVESRLGIVPIYD